MKNPTTTILLFISLTFTIGYVTSQIIHDVQYLVGCFVNRTETEIELTVDGDEAFYVDFQRGELVFTYPLFIDTIVPSIFDDKHMFVNAGKHKRVCHDVLSAMTNVEKNPPEEQEAPDSFLYASEEVELGVENTLICYVRHFYPPSLQVSWSRNGVAVSGASLSRYFPDEDGTFHQFSSLDIIPHEGDEYSCSVTHPALDQPTVRFWDSEPEQVVKASSAADVVCAVGLILGTLAAAGGMFLLVKSGRVCQPSEGVL